MDGYDKIRVKGGPKVYKRGPRPTGRKRLEQRVLVLFLEAVRFARKTAGADASYAGTLAHALRQFLP